MKERKDPVLSIRSKIRVDDILLFFRWVFMPWRFIIALPLLFPNLKSRLRLGLSGRQKLETNYYDRMYENCHISASPASRHLKIGKERAYTMIYHKMDLFLSRSNYVRSNMA